MSNTVNESTGGQRINFNIPPTAGVVKQDEMKPVSIGGGIMSLSMEVECLRGREMDVMAEVFALADKFTFTAESAMYWARALKGFDKAVRNLKKLSDEAIQGGGK